MTEPKPQPERRIEPRLRGAADRISWTRKNATRTCTGWISNTAASSIAFVAPTRDQPVLGETIELTFGPGSSFPQHQRVRVVRTTRHDRFFSLVGCKKEPVVQRSDA